MQKNRCSTVAFLLIFLLAGSVSASTFPDDWNMRGKIVFPSSFIGSNLTAHPESFTWENLPWELISSNSPFPAQADGGDIRFTLDSAGTSRIALDLANWDPTVDPSASKTSMWSPFDRLAATDAVGYVWWNTSEAETQPPEDSALGKHAVWDDDFWLVMHFEEASGTLVDASQRGFDFVVNGSPGFAQDGIAGNSVFYDENDYHSRIPTAGLNADLSSTISAFVYPTGEVTSDVGRIYTQANGTGSDRIALMSGSVGHTGHKAWSRRQLSSGLSTIKVDVGDATSVNTWAHTVMTFTRSGTQQIYVNGVSVKDTTTTGNPAGSATVDSFGIGGHPNSSTRYFVGRIDELRYSDVVRSADWNAADNSNLTTPATYALDERPMFRGSGVWWGVGTSTIIDTWIDSSNETTNYGNDTVMFAGDLGGAFIERCIISMSGLVANIGTENNITSASFFIYDQELTISTGNFDLHEGKRDSAVELESTWLLARTGEDWGTPGAENTTSDYNVSIMTSVSISAIGIYEFALDTAFINAALQGNDTASFILRVTDGAGRLHQFTTTEAGANQPGFKFVWEAPGVTSKNYRHTDIDMGERHNPTSASLTKRHEP